MKKIILFISLSLLVSCSNNPSSTSSSTNPLNKLFFASDLEEKDLPKPKEKISSLDEMIYALDYLAFYQIDKKVSFYIDNNYSKTFYNIYQEFSKKEVLPQEYKSRYMIYTYLSNNGVAIGYLAFDNYSKNISINYMTIILKLLGLTIESMQKKYVLSLLNKELENLYVKDSLTHLKVVGFRLWQTKGFNL